MRKLAFMAALVSSALATPALARDGAWYVGVEGGGLLVEDLQYDLTSAAGARTNNGVVVDSNYGFDVGGTVGYDFGAFRLEGEVAYKRAEVDDITMVGGLFCARVACTPAGLQPGGRYNGSGNTQALSFMINGMLDFGPDDGLQGFIGGGAGVARVKAGINRVANQVILIDDSDTRFAYQGIAGVRAPITQNVDAGLKYRFFNVDDVKLLAGNGRRADTRFRSHSLLFTLAYNFGEPAAPPPPPPPPPPPVAETPPPPPPPAIPGPFIVFFDWNKSDITTEAAGILDNAAAAYAQTGQASVMLAGHADKSGSDQYNVGLSQRRADAVKSYLAGKGVPDTAIATEAFGESRPLVETADGVREPQNRRVEISFGPGSGS